MEWNTALETTFVAAFPGIFLYSLDSTKVLKAFQQIHKDKYAVEIAQPENWKEQDFCISFSQKFTEEAYVGYKQKGQEEYKRAKSVERIFTQSYMAKLSHFGVLQISVIIPDDWDDFTRKIAEVEIGFQLYHVAKTIFSTLQELEKLELNEFRKFYTYLGFDGIEGLGKKFALAIKESFAERIVRFRSSLEDFKASLGTTRFFQITVLQKHEAFKKLMEYRSLRVEGTRTFMEREFISLFRRLLPLSDCMQICLNLAQEGVILFQRFAESLDRIQEMLSSQLEISSTFFEVLGLTITVSGIAFSVLPPINSTAWVVLLGIIFFFELTLLARYSTGAMIERELQSLVSESRVYQSLPT